MEMLKTFVEHSYQERIEALRSTKIRHTKEKWRVIGAMDLDDSGLILPPEEDQKVVQVIGGPGLLITDVLYTKFNPKKNHPSGGFFGARSCGENFRHLLEIHPVYIDPVSSLAGAYMVNFLSYRDPAWNPDFDYSHLHEEQKKYKLHTGIGAAQHFCQDMTIGFELGWGGILDKINHYREINKDEEAQELYIGLDNVVLGMQNWISRNAKAAGEMAVKEKNRQHKENLLEIADINERLVTDSPKTFREACQWMVWYQMASKMSTLR